MPIALNTLVLAQVNGNKVRDSEKFNPIAQLQKRQRAKREIPRDVASTFLQLARENKLPGWVVALEDVEAFRMVVEG